MIARLAPVLFACLLAACDEAPELPDVRVPDASQSPYPALLPLDDLPAPGPAEDLDALADDLARDADALQARAAALRRTNPADRDEDEGSGT